MRGEEREMRVVPAPPMQPPRIRSVSIGSCSPRCSRRADSLPLHAGRRRAEHLRAAMGRDGELVAGVRRGEGEPAAAAVERERNEWKGRRSDAR